MTETIKNSDCYTRHEFNKDYELGLILQLELIQYKTVKGENEITSVMNP